MKLAALLVGMCLLAGAAAAQPVFTIGPSNIANTWGNPQFFSYPTRFGAGPSGITYSGASTPAPSLAGIFATATVSGYPNDGGQPALNYFKTNSTVNFGDFGYRFWEDVGNSAGGHAAVYITAGNDNFSGYTIPTWTTGTVYAQGQIVVVSYNVMRATSSGTSGAVTPTCSSSVATCSDGTVSWHYWTAVGYSQTLVGATIIANPTVSWGGTATGPSSAPTGGPIGEAYGLNVLGTCQHTFGVYCVGEELDFGIPAGDSYETRVGEQIVIEPGSVAGSVEDVGWRIASQGSGAAGLADLMTWGSQTSDPVISTTGYGLRVYTQGGGNGTPVLMAGAGALDLLEFNPGSTGPFGAGFILRGPGSQILGNGDFQSNYTLLHSTGSGATLDVSEYHVTGVAVTGGSSGTGWSCTGKWADGSDGSIVSVDTISGGAVTGITLIKGAYSATNTSPATFTAEQPRNCGPLSLTGTPIPPSTFSVNLTWTQQSTPTLTVGGIASVAIPSTLTVGAGSGIASLLVNGGNGTAGGPQIVFENAGTARGYMGAYSSIFGGTFNFVLAIANGGSGIDLAFEPLEVGSPTGGMPSAGSVNISGVYQVNGTAGVTCSGAPTGSFASVGGVVTHC